MTELTIKLPTCRSDGRCPECGRDWTERGVLSRLPLPPCGCHCCPDCGLGHTRGLLTEALRQRDARIFAADLHAKINRYFEDIRPLSDSAGWTDPFDFLIHKTLRLALVEIDHLREDLAGALRDVEQWKAKAIRVSGEADVLEKERDEALEDVKTLRELVDSQREQVESNAKDLYAVVKERDEARSEVKTLRLLVDSQTEQISRSAMDLYAAVQSEVAAEKRSEKAEEERDEAQAKLVEEREAMASISGELVQAQVKVAKERDSYRAALEECGELRSEARERAERAEALLRECLVPLTDRGYPTEALVAKIKGCLS